jgi:acyl-CoA synthetase (AMP-forming)/AMP-acid ligase II
MRIIDYFDRAAAIEPGRACLTSESGSATFAEVGRRTHQFAKCLIAEGLVPGEKAAVIGPNCAEMFECILGIFRADGCWVPINYRSGTAENVYILNAFDVDFIFYHGQCADQVRAFIEQCPRIRRFIAIDSPLPGHRALRDWLRPDDGPAPERGHGRDDIVTISPTGGTTGKPKGVMWSNLTWQTMISNQLASQPSRAPVHLVVAPISHAAGVIGLVHMFNGATNVVLPGFDAEAVIDAIGRYRVTNFFLPPTALYMLLAHPRVREGDYSSLEYFYHGAAPTSVEAIRKAVEIFGPVMATGFGQVEAPASCCYLAPWELAPDGKIREDMIGSCGRPMLNTRVAIMDDSGTLLPPGEAGEIVVRGNLVMSGYYKDPDATAAVSGHGWHHTGDIGYFNERNCLFIVDRKKDMIISGGFNIYPSEVEQVLWSHPAVQDCAVIGVPDDKWGEAVKAVVQARSGHATTEQELLAFCRDALGGVKAPKSVEFIEQLPRSAAGKVSKKELRERYWQGLGRRI